MFSILTLAFTFALKESTKKLTAPHLLTGMKAILSGIAETSLYSLRTQKTGDADSESEESRLTLLWRGSLSFLGSRLCCITCFSIKTTTLLAVVYVKLFHLLDLRIPGS